MRVLVLAQGNGRRWGMHLGRPKHLVNVEGETVLARAVRLFADRGCDVIVVGPDDDRYRVPGSQLVTLDAPSPTGRESVDKFLGCRPLWSQDRTVIVWGDCYYTDEAADTIVAHREPGLHYFRRTGPSQVTGHRWDESFAVSFTADAHDAVEQACARMLAEIPAGRNDHIFHHYAAHLGLPNIMDVTAVKDTPGQTVIDDFTDDFDHPQDYWTWLAKRRTALPLSCVVMAHPRRSGWATDLAVELDCQVVWDRGKGLWDTARRAIGAYDPAASHHVVIQDDAVLSAGMLESLSRAVAVPGQSPVGLYVGRTRNNYGGPIIKLAGRAQSVGSPWIVTKGPKWAVGVAHPVSLIDRALELADGETADGDDTRMTAAYQKLGVDCWYTAPSLVDHREGPSIVRGRVETGRRAFRFAPDALSVDWYQPPVGSVDVTVPMTFRSKYPTLIVPLPDGRDARFRDGVFIARDVETARFLAENSVHAEALR